MLLALVLVPAAALLVRRLLQGGGGPARSLARPADVRNLLPTPAAGKARQLRPGLEGKPSVADSGVTLGELVPAGQTLVASWEDVLLAVMAPRAGKTTALAVPAVLAAPGPVLLTSNKSDAWAATRQLREDDTHEQAWTFDPQRITRSRQGFWWDPLAALTGVEDAERLAGHFVQMVEDGKANDIWGGSARELLAALFLAAALDGQNLVTAYNWLQSEVDPTAAAVLEQAGYGSLAASLHGTMSAPAETRGGVLHRRPGARGRRRDRAGRRRHREPPGARPARQENQMDVTLDELAAVVTMHGQLLDDLDQAVADLGAAAAPAALPERLPAAFPSLALFVATVIAPLYATHPPAVGWCPRWHEHPEAVVRLEAVWRAWEVLHRDGNMGMAKWLREVADPQLDRLRSTTTGPFAACTGGRHLPAPPLPTIPVPVP